MSRYPIPRSEVRVETRVSNSRFITTVAPAPTVADAQSTIKRVRAEMPDASHHVYAFKVGYGASVQEGMSDDGEPSGTSGPPTLAVLRGADIGDVVLVTTRYFGGTKLGTGGLVAAYTRAAQAALAAVETEEKVDRVALVITIPYRLNDLVRRRLAELDCVVTDEQFAAEVTLTLRIAEEEEAALAHFLADVTGGACTPRRT